MERCQMRKVYIASSARFVLCFAHCPMPQVITTPDAADAVIGSTPERSFVAFTSAVIDGHCRYGLRDIVGPEVRSVSDLRG